MLFILIVMLFILIVSSREKRVLKEGSEEFSKTYDIPANDFIIVDFEQEEVFRKYLPLNELTTLNLGATDVVVYYNQSKDDKDEVPSGAIISHDHKNVRTLKIENKDTVNAAKITIRAKKKPITTNDLLRRLIP